MYDLDMDLEVYEIARMGCILGLVPIPSFKAASYPGIYCMSNVKVGYRVSKGIVCLHPVSR